MSGTKTRDSRGETSLIPKVRAIFPVLAAGEYIDASPERQLAMIAWLLEGEHDISPGNDRNQDMALFLDAIKATKSGVSQ